MRLPIVHNKIITNIINAWVLYYDLIQKTFLWKYCAGIGTVERLAIAEQKVHSTHIAVVPDHRRSLIGQIVAPIDPEALSWLSDSLLFSLTTVS